MADFEHLSVEKESPVGEFVDFDDIENEFVRNDTQILNLEDGPEAMSVLPDSVPDGEAAYPNFDENLGEDEKELSPDGVLDEDTIALGLTNLGRSADGAQQVFLHMVAAGYRLSDISILAEYEHLQRIELPYNDITDLSPLGNIPYLLELDVSHNQISRLLDFTPPKNLKSADFSFNNIEDMVDLSAHHYLHKLTLDNNHISEIRGLEKCGRLKNLSAAHNKLTRIQGLGSLPIKHLNLSCNELKKIENLEGLTYLQHVDVSGNQIRSMAGLQGHVYLEDVNLEDNEVIDLAEVQYVQHLDLLRHLNLQRNPIRELPDYRLSILYHLKKITELDKQKVDVEEKVSASNMFSPPMEVIAARDHVMHIVYNFLQPSRILDSTLPSPDTPYPMLVLVGPQGAGKKDLALKLCEEFPDYFGYGISTTTRPPHSEEVNGRDYNFVSLDEFEAEIKNGKFLETYAYHGELYGLTMDAIEAVAKEGLACVVHMELEGVLTLKNTYFEPRYVLLMPLTRDLHERRLRERDVYTEQQTQWMLDRSELYAEYHREHPGFFDMFINSVQQKFRFAREFLSFDLFSRSELYAEYQREHPGFFDMFINSDDISDCYKRLRKLVMDYLGISAPTPTASEVDHENTESNILGRENTDQTFATSANIVNQTFATSANIGMGARTWSKHSLTDSVSQAMANIKTRQAQSPILGMARGIVEEKSMERRKSALKDAVAGTRPSLYQQILNEKPQTVPITVSGQMGLGIEEADSVSHPSKDRIYSAPTAQDGNMDALPPASPDSSLSGGEDDDTLSNISEAREIEHQATHENTAIADGYPSELGQQDDSQGGETTGMTLPQDTMERLELMSGGTASKGLSTNSVPLAPRPGSQTGQYPPGTAPRTGSRSGERPDSARSVGRPGSDRHPILPPIGSG